MAGNRAAGSGHVDIFEIHSLLNGSAHQFNIRIIDSRMRNKNPVSSDIIIGSQLILRILHQNLFQISPVFLTDSHSAGSVIHLNTGLKIQKIRSQSGNGGTSPPRVHEFQGIQYKAGMTISCSGFQRITDL